MMSQASCSGLTTQSMTNKSAFGGLNGPLSFGKKKAEAQENEVSNVLYEHMCFDITKRVQENGEE